MMKFGSFIGLARAVCLASLSLVITNVRLVAQVDWVSQSSPTQENLASVAFGNGVFVAVGDSGTLLRSVDSGQTWVNRTDQDVSIGGLRSVAFGGGVFMAGAGDEVLISTDLGLTWRPATPTPEWLSDLAYGNDRWFAASGTIAASINRGTSWSPVSSIDFKSASLVFQGNIGVSVGGTIATSQDGGLSWTDVADGQLNWQTSVAYGNGLYVSVGGVFGNIITKTSNPLIWSEAGSTNLINREMLLSVAYGGETFVVVGGEGQILYSNGQSPWTPAFSGTKGLLRDVAYGNGTFVVVGDGGTILTSGRPPEITGSLAAQGTVGLPFSYTITALYGPTEFVAQGLPPNLTVNPESGVISGIPSQVGVSNVTLLVSNAYGSDSKTLVITIGSGGGTGVDVKIHTAVELEFNTRVGHTYRVESSPNLSSWSNFGDPIPGNGQTQYRLYSTRDANHRFYRVREE